MHNDERSTVVQTDERAKVQSIRRGNDPVPPMQADRHTSTDPAVETPIEGRQGFLGRPVLLVLVGGLSLAIAAGILVTYLTH
jgi:hypothetical protein